MMKQGHFIAVQFTQFLIFLSSVMLLTACTENFLFDNNKVEDDVNRRLSGQVILSDASDRDSVAVWLEGFNQLAWTNSKGRFSLTLPEPNTQPGQGLDGIYDLFFFLGNYEITKSSVLIRDGELQLGYGDVNQNGSLIDPKYVQKMINIKTNVEPNIIENTYKDPILFTVTLTNVLDSVTVKTFKRSSSGNTSCIIIKEKGAPLSQALLLRGNNTTLSSEMITEKTEWRMAYQFTSGFFDNGEYLIIPYIIVEQKTAIPEALLSTLGDDVYNFTSEYLRIPIKLESAVLTVRSLDN